MDTSNTNTEATDVASGSPESMATTTSSLTNEPNLDQTDDGGRDRKEKTASTTSTGKSDAPRPRRPPPIYVEDCPVCLEPLQVDTSTYNRLVCCGQGLHEHCLAGIRESTMTNKQKNSCVMCRAEYPRTPKEEVKMTRIWVEKGKAWAQTNLAGKYERGDGVKQSYKKSLKLYRAAVKQNDSTAMYALGYMYNQGHVVTQSYEKAVKYYSLAVDQGHRGAQYNLGCKYERGEGVQQSDEKACELYKLAAVQGNVNAQYNLGYKYVHGQGVDQSNKIAREWWTKAADQGNETAIQNLKRLDEEEGKTTTTTTTTSAPPPPST